ncbi:E3 ubiquitin-protein ligase hyd isoform X1 [Zeugodacus cucurbitae]|uniref:E3 ubiquitin-protein ligase hyd isoform X1 n=1 Tax=Zeugodacus cucurbitae TaxID=28588 RepID=UPI0023D94636|nr:E3 ubiquitin-protein ligase hyd isoform X1 [Zeugodacus cucurbitae]
MSAVQFVIQPLPGSDEQYIERLREVSDKVNRFGCGTHRIFEQLKIPVKEMVIGPNHIGVLLEDGKAFRAAFSINSDRLDLSRIDSSKSNANNSSNLTNNSKNAAPSSARQLARSRARLMRTTGRSGSTSQSSGSRSTGVIIGSGSSSRPIVTVPATYVPEELISQAEVVLQGKSRNLIIRELQRTNLDVNLAVNNLLSRDDEEAEDTEEAGDNYVPEDLISLLDNGFHGDNNSVIIDPSDGLFSEEIFSNYSSIRNLLFDRIRSERNQSSSSNSDNQVRPATTSGSVLSGNNSLSAQISSVSVDREAFSRWRDRQYYGPRRWLNKDDYVWENNGDLRKRDTSSSSPLWISEELQPWPDKNGITKFKRIGALYSEFIALSENGELHQWKWSEIEPYKSEIEHAYHPKTVSLNINEKVGQVSANFIRCSVVTESGRVATWMDDQIGYLGAKLEHPTIMFNEFVMDPIASINVCSLYTAVRTENNNIYWWGVLPFDQRRYLWDKFRTKSKKPFKSISSDISVGTQVIMKKCPIYQAGSIGFTCYNGIPKIGQLQNSVWDLSDVCRFKIITLTPQPSVEKSQLSTCSSISTDKDYIKAHIPITVNAQSTSKSLSATKETTDRIDMPPPPSPASSTCSDTGSVTSHKRTKRMATKDDVENKKDEELWQLRDVVFVEDKVGPVGKVLKVDGDFVAVRFPIATTSTTSAGSNNGEGKDDDWQQCRLLRREDVQIYKTNMASRGLDWLQKMPRKVNINNCNDSNGFQLLTMSVDVRGVHVIKKHGSKLFYSLYNLYNSKQEQICQFPTDSVSFLGVTPDNINILCNNDSSVSTSNILVCDGNRALYPIAKDCLGSIKDPYWLDLPPVKNVSMSMIPFSSAGNLKSKLCLTALVFESQKLMPHILRCDIKNAFAVLSRLEKNERNDIVPITEERCDGGRNIFHACVALCAPTSNKEVDEKRNVSGINRSSPLANTVFTNCPNLSTHLDINNGVAATNAGPSSNTNATVNMRENRSVTLREMMNHLINTESEQNNPAHRIPSVEDHIYIPQWSIEGNSTNQTLNDVITTNEVEDDLSKSASGNATSINSSPSIASPNYVFEPMQRREHAILILQQMCSSAAFRPYLHQMLSFKDSQGRTPFMISVYTRAYEAGIILLNTILSLSEKDAALKNSMIFPPGSPPDQSPLYVICYNDTCSFTWTGADHINQNIYECKTCGLTGSLCCCTECARVCHKGHDCKLKRTSPTAYCDCWEKCKCKALIAGNQNKRFALLCKLSSCTDLVTRFNSKGESILLFLIQTVGRQTVEQRQYRANARVRNVGSSSGSGTSRKSSTIDLEADMPEHDLEPPKFARKALERLLIDWHAIRAMIMTGADKNENPQTQPNSADALNTESYNMYVMNQQGSTLLDKFTHNLFVKCSGDHLDTLLMTLVREMQDETTPGRREEAELVARRFIRSVVRVFVIFSLEKMPNPERRKSNLASNKHIQNCVKVFQSLYKISIEELCEVSESLIAPVRLGIVRPTAPFTMSSTSIDSSDDLFSVEPLAPSSTTESLTEPVSSHEENQTNTPGYNMQSNFSMDNIDVLRDAQESDDTNNRGNRNISQEEDILDSARNEEVIQDDESDNDFPFNDPETESDSDDNQSNQDAQRSVQTGATVGSETDIGVLFLEDESGDSSPQEEEASEDGETDEQSDEFNFADHQLERRNTSTNARNDLAPQSMQWAIRNRDTSRSSVRVPAGSNLVFIDPMALRRSTVPTSSTVAVPPQEHHTMATTASNLARAFGIIIRQISDLLNNFTYQLTTEIERPTYKAQMEEAIQLQMYIEDRLKSTWNWMYSIMDGTEPQLKFGAYLTNYTDPTHPLHPLNLNTQNTSNQSSSSSAGINIMGSSTRRDFFTYCLSLMRAHTSEHRDALPVLDITAFRHIAYVFDGFIYYMRNNSNFYEKTDQLSNISNINENDDTDDEFSNITNEEMFPESSTSAAIAIPLSATTRRHSFFVRSESTLSLGCLAPDNFDLPLDVAIPLADKPHLLQPNSKREDLFSNLPLLIPTEENTAEGVNMTAAPTKLGFSSYKSIPTSCVKFGNSWKTELDSKLRNIEPMDTDENVPRLETLPNVSNPINSSRPEVIITPNKMQKTEEDSPQVSNFPTTSSARSVIVRASSVAKNIESERNLRLPFQEDVKRTNITFPPRGINFCKQFSSVTPSWNFLLGRWKLTLDLFGRVFMDDVGMEHGSLLPELRGFPVKEVRFRRHMEKLRNGQQRDLILCKLERSRECLIIQTFKELNAQFGSQTRRVQTPLTFNRVKVTFKDEPGEGSGVARSFYTSIAEALLASAKMPNLESTHIGVNNRYGTPFSSILRNRGVSSRDPPSLQRRTAGNKIFWRTSRERKLLNYDARPYVPAANHTDGTAEPNEHLSVHLQQLGERLFPKICSINATNASKITGMLLEIPTPQLLSILSSEDSLRQKVNEALDVITYKQKSEANNTTTQTQKKMIPVVLLEQGQIEDNEPLFYSPGKRGFYTPRQGYGSFERINAFRNIGRLIGLCLLQNELLPLFLQRHVLKFILGRKIKFYDLAFFDPIIYESFRQLILNAQSDDGEATILRMELFFVIDLMKEEGGGSIELLPGGREIQVTSNNLFEYLKRYTEYRLIKSQEKALEGLRDGVFDVLPDSCMNSLTAEDLRLLLNGVGDINVSTLISYTTFNDESSEGSDKLLKFKRWFWSIVEKMNTSERQDLVYFWTGSPALPASEEGFQPLPSVTIRPADDTHLPTANTCISRLYIPLYSSKTILRSKLLMAIKSKNFGFV